MKVFTEDKSEKINNPNKKWYKRLVSNIWDHTDIYK